MQLNTLYAHQCVHLAAGDEGDQPLPFLASTKKLVLKALKRFFNGKGKVSTEVDPDLWQATFDTLDHAIKEGMGSVQYDKPNYKLTQQLRESAALFSAQKSWAQANELAKIAASKPGYQITWKEFKEAAKPIVGDYNERWLRTEYNTAIRAARQASLWKQYEDTAHLYPNLRYMPSRAATPREEHKPYYGIVRPINDDFWIKHMPPSAWNCQCGVEQTDDEVTPLPTSGPAPAPGLDENPGLTGKLFSDTHPLAKEVAKAGKAEAVAKRAAELKRKRDYAVLKKDADFKAEMNSSAIQLLEPSFPELDRMGLTAIRYYTDVGFGRINDFKRGNSTETPFLLAYGDVLQAALNRLPERPGQTYRRAVLAPKYVDIYRQALKDDREVTHADFTSTSKRLDPPFSGNVYYIVDGKTGRDIEKISHFGHKEQEVLLRSDTRFKVVKFEEGKGSYVIHLVELDQ